MRNKRERERGWYIRKLQRFDPNISNEKEEEKKEKEKKKGNQSNYGKKEKRNKEAWNG